MTSNAVEPSLYYRLSDARGESLRIDIHQHPEHHGVQVDADYTPPDWARLEHHQCSHCPLDPAEHSYCPIAANLAFLLPNAELGESFREIRLEVGSPARTYFADTTVQRALSSLFGLVCALSDCPHTRFLRPMALFHLPVSTETETLVRTAGFFLLQRYLARRRDPALHVDLDGLDQAYDRLKELNHCFVRRFRAQDTSDAPVNAMVLLHVLAKEMNWELDDELEALAPLFRQ
ncbi:DUF6901 family protein [Alloalcanivorax mobilis]|uniref:DUF6901 family protein n=1 Tax=Alloalcanivorax mobilis TaxID=2019569 RepID=UPI000C761B7F|nr:hypothetical protein [Alloalcanivorax mobilis]